MNDISKINFSEFLEKESECLFFSDNSTNEKPKALISESNMECSCGSTDIVSDIKSSSYVCTECGMNIANYIDNSNPHRYYNDMRTQDRAGSFNNNMLKQQDLGTDIEGFSWITKTNRWNRGNLHKSIRDKWQIIDEKCHSQDALFEDIPESIVKEAKALYALVHRTKKIYGINRAKQLKMMLAACVHIAIKNKRSKETMNTDIESTVKRFCGDVSDAKHLSKKLTQLEKIIWEQGQSNVKMTAKERRKMDIHKYIYTYCLKLMVSAYHNKIAEFISNKLREYRITGQSCTNKSSAAVSIMILFYKYGPSISSTNDIDKSKIIEVCGVSDVTINKIIKKLRDYCKTSSKTPFSCTKYDIIFPEAEVLEDLKMKTESKPGKGQRVCSDEIKIVNL